MSVKDMRSYFVPVVGVTPAVISADNTPATIDLQGFKAACLLVHIGAGGITFDTTNKVEIVLTHSSDDTTYTNVSVDDVEGILAADLTSGAISGGIIKKLIAAHATETVYKFDYVGGKRYLKVLFDFSGTHGTGTKLGCTVLKNRPDFTQNVATADLKSA